jgi:thiaminase
MLSLEASPVATIRKLLEGVSHELQLHESYAAKWGLTPQEINDPSPATKAYTDFLLDVAEDPKVSWEQERAIDWALGLSHSP